MEYDQQATPTLVGRAMTKVFGAVFRNKVRKMYVMHFQSQHLTAIFLSIVSQA